MTASGGVDGELKAIITRVRAAKMRVHSAVIYWQSGRDLMTTVNTIEDLVRILDEHPEWLEAFRARLLTREVLELPQAVAELTQRVDVLTQRVGNLTQLVAELTQRMDNLTQLVAELTQRMDAMVQRQDRMQDDLGWIKGRIIYDIVRDDAAQIADDMGFTLERTLVRADLRRLTERHDVSDLPRGDVRSFRRADLVMQVADGEGNPHYIAVEASFTVNGRDSRRALRNAELMTRFTGLPAVAAVAGVRYDWNLKDSVESEQLYWYEIPSEDLEAE